MNYFFRGSDIVNSLFRITLVVACVLGSHGTATAQKVSPVNAVFEKACKDIEAQVEKLTKRGKDQEAAQLQGALDVLADIAPQDVPKFKRERLAKELVGRWVRASGNRTYEIGPSGNIKQVGVNWIPVPEGTVAVDDPEYAEVIFKRDPNQQNGGEWRWRIYRVSKDRMAVNELKDAVIVGDGFFLTRVVE